MVATPGRLADILKGSVGSAPLITRAVLIARRVRSKEHNKLFSHMQFLVLDEADRLFEKCFEPVRVAHPAHPSRRAAPRRQDMNIILNSIPPVDHRQTLLFSATITEARPAAACLRRRQRTCPRAQGMAELKTLAGKTNKVRCRTRTRR